MAQIDPRNAGQTMGEIREVVIDQSLAGRLGDGASRWQIDRFRQQQFPGVEKVGDPGGNRVGGHLPGVR